MSVKQEKTENKNEVKLTFTVDNKRFEDEVKAVFKENAKYFNVPGFRKGRAPFNIVVKYYGEAMFYQEASSNLIARDYPEEVEENKLEVLGKPEFSVLQVGEGKDFIYTAIVATRPEIKLPKYKGMEIEKKSYSFTKKDLDEELNKLANQNSRKVTVEDREVKKDDIVNIDYSGTVDGKAFEGGTATNYDLTIGSNTFIKGFEDQIIGMKIEEEKDINVTFPKPYFSKDLEGKDAVFHVKLNSISELKLPKIDDEFAKDVSEFDTLDELKKDIKKKHEEENKDKAEKEMEDEAMKTLSKNTEFDMPKSIVEGEVDQILEEFDSDLRHQGMSLESYMNYTGETLDTLRDRIRPDAKNRAKNRMIIEEVVKAENIKPTQKDVDEYLDGAAKYTGQTVEDLKKNEKIVEYAETVSKTREALRFLAKNAKLVEKKEEKKEDKKESSDKEKTTKKTAKKDEKETKKTAAKKSEDKK